jgi:hypothetical protein
VTTPPVRTASKRQLEAAQSLREFDLKLRRYELVAGGWNTLVRWGGAVLIVYFFYRTVGVLAGRDTTADIGIRMLANVRLSEAVAWIFGLSGGLYGIRQKKMRTKVNEHLGGRVSDLEREIDAGRSSSKLTRSGQTQPGDAI